MSTETQNAQILDYLTRGRSITAMEALRLCDCFRLAARIHDLKQAGHVINGMMVDLPNGKRVKRYWLEQKKGRGEQE